MLHRKDAPPVAIRSDASSLADLEALAATSGGRKGRAIVQWTAAVSDSTEGHRGGNCVHQVIVRARELDGGFGPNVKKSVLLPREAALLIGAGLEVPIIRDPPSGELEEVDRRALVDELRPMFAEAREAEKARRGATATVDALREAITELRQPRAATEPPDTVAGVTADQWLQARRVLAKGRIPETVIDRTLAAYGIPAGRWPEVDAGWSDRAARDPAIADRLANL